MAAKVGKKKKGKTMALTDFLSDEQGNVQGPGTSYVLANKSLDWAAEMEEQDTTYPEPYADKMVDRAKLPTAPKASRGPNVDLASLPNEPPFTAFIGNLPYEATEDKIINFFNQLPVVNVRLPEDNGRFRGFGYVEFETKQALIDALAMSEDTMGGRKIRVDLAGQNQQHAGGRDKGGDPDRTDSDWRQREPSSGGGGSGWGRDRGGDRYGNRESGRSDQDGPWERSSNYADRGPSRNYDDRGGSRGGGYEEGGGFRDRGSYGGDRDRGYDDRRYGDRDGGRRGYGSGFRRDERDGDRYGDRRGYGDRDRGYGDRDRGYGDRDRGYGDRDHGYGNRDRGYGDRDRGYGDRDRGYGDRDRGYGDRDRGYGGDRDRSYGDRERDDGYGYRRSDRRDTREPSHEEPKERPRLQLQPRSKAVEKGAGQSDSSSSIFGGAKPVDTAQKEREIEERLIKQRQEQAAPAPRSYRYEEDKENRDTYNTERPPRKRSDSDRSQDGDSRRERRLSSGSGKGRKVPPPVTSQRSRKDSEHSSHSNEVFSGNEDIKEDTPVSPSVKEEPPAKLIPAPPPKENIWEKRKTQFSPPQKQEEPKSPPPVSSASTLPKSEPQQTPPSKPQHNNQSAPTTPKSPGSEGPSQVGRPPLTANQKKEFVPAEPPKENPWMKRKQEMENQSHGHRTEPAAVTRPPPPSGAWAPGRGAPTGDRGRGRGGRGGSSDRGRGRGAKPQKHSKERPLPKSIEDMPKLEEKTAKNFSDSNKFAGLIDEDDAGFEEEA